MTLKEFIAANEFAWWCEKLSHAKVRALIKEHTGVKVPAKNFRVFLSEHCKVYSVWRRKPKSTQKVLSNEQWDKLKYAVEKSRPTIDNCGISDALQVVLVKISTNISQLKGLPKRLHYWE